LLDYKPKDFRGTENDRKNSVDDETGQRAYSKKH